MKKRPLWSAVLMAAFLLGGCSSVISPELRKEARAGLTLAQVSRNPDMYRGATVIWGGVIQELKNLDGEAYLRVAETPLDWHQFPGGMDSVRGTFVAQAGFLEPEIYAKGRRVTLAGRIEGRGRAPWQGIPLVLIRQIHLWPESPPDPWGAQRMEWGRIDEGYYNTGR